jgi:hypothetical protein
VVTLTLPQERRLAVHAAALQLTPDEALTALLDAPPVSSAPARKPWSATEIDMLLNPANRTRDIARRTGRTPASVANKRSKLLRAVAAESEGEP